MDAWADETTARGGRGAPLDHYYARLNGFDLRIYAKRLKMSTTRSGMHAALALVHAGDDERLPSSSLRAGPVSSA